MIYFCFQSLVRQLMEGLNSVQPMPQIQEWHASVHTDLRNHLVNKVASLMCPICALPDLLAYAKEVEGLVYSAANSSSEYYQLLNEKICKMRRDLGEKLVEPGEPDLAARRILEDLEEDLVCPVCLDIPRSIPIYQCERGHSICKICQPRLTACPLCRITYGNQGPIRALMTERCVTKIPSLKCRYADHGCQQPKMTLAQLEEHERDCEFRCEGTCVGACGGACAGWCRVVV